MSGPELLQWYRQRGRAEGSQGEFKSVLNPALSSSPRPKRHYRGKSPATRSPAGDSFARNEAWLLLSLLAYHFLHAARVFLEQATSRAGASSACASASCAYPPASCSTAAAPWSSWGKPPRFGGPVGQALAMATEPCVLASLGKAKL